MYGTTSLPHSTYPHFPGHYFLCYQTSRDACQNWSLVRRVCEDFARVPRSVAEREKRRDANDGYSLLCQEDTWVSLDHDWIEHLRYSNFFFLLVFLRRPYAELTFSRQKSIYRSLSLSLAVILAFKSDHRLSARKKSDYVVRRTNDQRLNDTNHLLLASSSRWFIQKRSHVRTA